MTQTECAALEALLLQMNCRYADERILGEFR